MTHSSWQPIETAPKDTAVLVYGFGYEVAHFNTALGKWVACWDHRPISRLTHWQPLPEVPTSTLGEKVADEQKEMSYEEAMAREHGPDLNRER